MVKQVEFYFFSPTGGTKKTGEIFCQQAGEQIHKIDLGDQNFSSTAASGDLAVFAMPVFGGRIPSIATERLQTLKGQGKKAVTLVVYGTRAYEDALLELNTIVTAQGFEIVASGAFIAQHSMIPEVGKGRPDEKDVAEIEKFAQSVLQKLKTVEKNPGQEITVPGNQPYKAMMSIPAQPITLEACQLCGNCVTACPTGAIAKEEKTIVTDKEKCILCLACVAHCPHQARIMPPPLQEKMEQMLGALKTVRRENEIFL